jgi:hypothetical protein
VRVENGAYYIPKKAEEGEIVQAYGRGFRWGVAWRRISPTLTPKMNTRGIPGGWRGVVKKFLFERIIWPLMRRGKDC